MSTFEILPFYEAAHIQGHSPRRRGDSLQRSTNHTTITDQVVTTIRSSIISGRLEPGKLYSVYKIADELGISRTPVREALLRLADAEMIRFERNRGFRVLQTSVRELQEVFQLRLLLEVPATFRTAQVANTESTRRLRKELSHMKSAALEHNEHDFMHHDRNLHEMILETSDNKKLATSVRHLRLITLTLGASTVDHSRTLFDILSEHSPIVEAIADHDPPAAAAAMRTHITNTGDLLINQLIREGHDDTGLQSNWATTLPPFTPLRPPLKEEP